MSRRKLALALVGACALSVVAAKSAPAGAPRPTPDPAPIPMTWLGVSLQGVDPAFLQKVAAATEAVGGTAIYVASGRRTRVTNSGVTESNHLCGHAIDGEAIIGSARIPLGRALKTVAAAYGLRSGDVPHFYKKKRDPYHVDDGYNLTHRCA